MKIAHIINPVDLGEQSDLHIAQPITFAAMKTAQAFAQGQVEVELFTTQYPEDRSIIPDGFTILPNLERSVLDFGTFQQQRKLPLVADILQRLYAASDADYFVITNVDIAPMPYFYTYVARQLQTHDALVINRRTITDKYSHVDDLSLMYADYGKIHPGYDCFVFAREAYPNYAFAHAVLGAAPVGKVLYANLIAFAQNFVEIKDAHLTFHIGDDRVWQNDTLQDYRIHNAENANEAFIQIREKVGKLDNSTAVGRYLVERYKVEGMHRIKPALLLDNSEDELKIPRWTSTSIKKSVKNTLRRLLRL